MSSLLSSPSSLLTGAILAGGHSSRFGSNKALFAPNGETLISKAAGLLRSVAREVLVSASQTNAGDYDFLGLEIVVDQHPDSGPALYYAMVACSHMRHAICGQRGTYYDGQQPYRRA